MAFIGPRPQTEHVDTGVPVPNLQARIDELLAVRASKLKIPPDIKQIHWHRIKTRVIKTTSAWCFAVSALVPANAIFEYYMVSRKIFLLILVMRVLLCCGFLAAGCLFATRKFLRFAPLYIGAPCVLTIILAGIAGLLTQNPAYFTGFMYEAILASGTAIIFVGFDLSFGIGLNAICIPIVALFVAISPVSPLAAKCQIVTFDACFVISLMYGRHAQNLVLARLFLLNMRDEFRNTEAAARENKLSSFAYTDPLTQIPNRRYFEEVSATLIANPNPPLPTSLCMIDIDHFKSLNDQLGHPQGDICLHQVAQCIRANLRNKTDIAARFGGEEFVLLLPGADLNSAYEVAERMRAAIMELGHPNPGSPFKTVTASLGVAETSHAPINIQSLLENADQALYRAKITGRNRVNT